MHEQVAERTERLRRRRGRSTRCGVARGRRRRRACGELFESARRDVARRRADAEPVDLRAARRHPRRPGRGGRRAARTRPNVIMAAERPPSCPRRTVRVVPSRSQQAGLAAARRARPDAQRRRRTPRRCSAALDARAHRRRHRRRPRRRRGPLPPRRGRRLRRRASSSPGASRATTLEAVLGELGRRAPSCSRCIAGDGAPLDGDAVAARWRPAASSVEYSRGGQPAYWWLLAAE